MTAPTRHLTEVRPNVPTARLLADLVPPRHFAEASFESYRANPAFPSQQSTVDRLAQVATQITGGSGGWLKRLRSGKGGKGGTGGTGGTGKNGSVAVYLDGGFGVGKTHLLASLAHSVGVEDTAYGTFVEYTNLVGALGFASTVEALASKRLVCIDEFELDDPGDTVLMSRLLRELADRGIALAATSNTLPDSLGEGRFAADDFLREIQAMAARFEVMRVDGEDYRQRTLDVSEPGMSDEAVVSVVEGHVGAMVDTFDELLDYLSRVHPSRYGALLDDVTLLGLTGVHPFTSQDAALRFVVLVDRLYDRDVPVLLGGTGLAGLFTQEMLVGGYRKKYFRSLSRLGSLAQDGAKVADRV